MDATEQAVYAALEKLGIAYQRWEHPPVATVAEAVEYWRDIDATHCKNLFLRNKKGDRHYLVIAEHQKPVELRALVERLGDDRLSFASAERLDRHLGLTPGSVSPFGLINDTAHAVRVIVDADLKETRWLAFHPNVNTATLRIATADFERFLGSTGNVVRFVRL